MKFKSLILMSGLLLFAGNASATLIMCNDTSSPAIASSGKNATSSITTAGTTAGATVNATNVCGPYAGNDSKAADWIAAGYSDWYQLDKANGADGALITGTNWGTTLGTFSFADAGYSDYLIVLKFDGVYSSFLSDSWADGWGWNTDTDNGGQFDISHLTVYARNPVPEPAIVGLLSIGLLGMVVARRRMKL